MVLNVIARVSSSIIIINNDLNMIAFQPDMIVIVDLNMIANARGGG